ncbi:TauD/TfdA family dioxygenase [Actinoplanes cyaneus]|uniref:TauD/TfdA family dioxygenase n=1 Tax=Actinoplanes cyaneus TaxID=52696 RepID=UPI0019434D8F|nr:TauD/TfdA family dioxygenase [Actinoplanes cyaneus]
MPRRLAGALAQVCTLEMDGHQWSAGNVTAARAAVAAAGDLALVTGLRQQLARDLDGPGWALVTLPPEFADEDLQVVSAAVLALIGKPFYSIEQEGRLWIGGPSSPHRDAASFGGFGAQPVHVDAPNVEHVPDYTSLLVLRPDPGDGGQTLLADLQSTAAGMTEADRGVLRRREFFEGRADRLLGVGAPLLPFPILDEDPAGGRPWIRWAGKLLHDSRNQQHLPVLRRFAAAIDAHTHSVAVGRGQLLIADQQRIAHGRTSLGPPRSSGHPRCLLQAKICHDMFAPAQTAPVVRHG